MLRAVDERAGARGLVQVGCTYGAPLAEKKLRTSEPRWVRIGEVLGRDP